MERIIVNLEDNVGQKLKARATSERRSYSGYVELLIEKDLRAAGLLPAEANASHTEFLGKVEDVVTRLPAVKQQIEKLLKSAEGTRRRQAVAAAR